MVRDKVLLKKAGLNFWKVGIPMDFHSHVHKKHMSKLGRRYCRENSSFEGMEKACAFVEAGSYTVIYAIHLFAACIQLLNGKQGNVLVVTSPEFLPCALTKQ